jgi:orotate phosphoribosyltransferase
MTSKDWVFEILKRTGALLDGHFRHSDGKHAREYIQCAKAFQWGEYGEEISKAIAERFKNQEIHIVIGPALGGILLAYEVGKALDVKVIFAERDNGVMSLRRGFEIPRGSKVLIVEDVVVTGASVNEVKNLVIAAGAQPVGIGCVANISGKKLDFGVDFQSIIEINIETYDEDNCPLCKAGVQLIGECGKKFI